MLSSYTSIYTLVISTYVFITSELVSQKIQYRTLYFGEVTNTRTLSFLSLNTRLSNYLISINVYYKLICIHKYLIVVINSLRMKSEYVKLQNSEFDADVLTL